MTKGFLEKYLKAEPNIFREYTGCSCTEHTLQFDNGDLIWSDKVIEIVPRNFDIKHLIPNGVSKHDVIRLLERMIDFVKVSGVDPDDINLEDFF